ncbi:hypothetical protein [Sinomicrobium soli]|uniref:hypothetical protein n=1 Tax=Sinomicrobium sp. N-1-3-6 TaxID=2219864 RepID=UPI000DCCD7E1|nr:hypothetical protein [Sinomicrobium sp. N-1-3-6]RAV28881.1 hypothetical protein DN748_10795 [Sinomicrobium sp. N-1-3-6]
MHPGFTRIVLISCAFLFLSCRKDIPHSVQFYYWKSHVQIEDTEKDYFSALGADRLYMRFFDVDLVQGAPAPVSVVGDFNPEILQAAYIPVVFITNRVMKSAGHPGGKSLAEDINSLIRQIAGDHGLEASDEIQIDCDWTESTRDTYFAFLEQLKKISGKKISCTLRLHQVKYRDRTGIPPADKVYLMAYATSSPVEDNGKNSILDTGLLKDYLRTIDTYPIKMDIALPLYSWAVVTNHLGRSKLINGVAESELQSPDFRRTAPHTYEVTEDVFLKGIYLNKGFHMRVEEISPELLKETRLFLEAKLQRPYDYVYYHLDSLFLQRFSPEDLR